MQFIQPRVVTLAPDGTIQEVADGFHPATPRHPVEVLFGDQLAGVEQARVGNGTCDTCLYLVGEPVVPFVVLLDGRLLCSDHGATSVQDAVGV